MSANCLLNNKLNHAFIVANVSKWLRSRADLTFLPICKAMKDVFLNRHQVLSQSIILLAVPLLIYCKLSWPLFWVSQCASAGRSKRNWAGARALIEVSEKKVWCQGNSQWFGYSVLIHTLNLLSKHLFHSRP